MPIFYLQPKDDAASDPSWARTTLTEGCWVLAGTEGQARDQVAQSTLKMADCVPGEPILRSPWLSSDLTACWLDIPAIEVPEGIIVMVGGKTIS